MLQDELELVCKEQYHAEEEHFDEYMYFTKEEDSGEEECKLEYKEDDGDENDNVEDQDKDEEWYEISERKIVLDPVLALDIYPLSWEDRDIIANYAYRICLPPNFMESHILYGEGMWYHVAKVIGDGFLKYTLLCDYRDSLGEFQMMATAYVADINRDKSGYIYDLLYKQVLSPHDV